MYRLLFYDFSYFSTLPNHFTPFNQDEFCFSCPFPANFLRSFVKLKTHRRDTRQKFPCFSLCLFVGRVHLSWFCLANFVAYVRFLDRRESVSVAVVFDVNASSKWQLLMVAPTFPQTFPLTRPRPLAKLNPLSNSLVSGIFLSAHFLFVFLSQNCKVITFD